MIFFAPKKSKNVRFYAFCWNNIESWKMLFSSSSYLRYSTRRQHLTHLETVRKSCIKFLTCHMCSLFLWKLIQKLKTCPKLMFFVGKPCFWKAIAFVVHINRRSPFGAHQLTKYLFSHVALLSLLKLCRIGISQKVIHLCRELAKLKPFQKWTSLFFQNLPEPFLFLSSASCMSNIFVTAET